MTGGAEVADGGSGGGGGGAGERVKKRGRLTEVADGS